MSESPCTHNPEYNAEQDNYYCKTCHVGMGEHYYLMAKRVMFLESVIVSLKQVQETQRLMSAEALASAMENSRLNAIERDEAILDLSAKLEISEQQNGRLLTQIEALRATLNSIKAELLKLERTSGANNVHNRANVLPQQTADHESKERALRDALAKANTALKNTAEYFTAQLANCNSPDTEQTLKIHRAYAANIAKECEKALE